MQLVPLCLAVRAVKYIAPNRPVVIPRRTVVEAFSGREIIKPVAETPQGPRHVLHKRCYGADGLGNKNKKKHVVRSQISEKYCFVIMSRAGQNDPAFFSRDWPFNFLMSRRGTPITTRKRAEALRAPSARRWFAQKCIQKPQAKLPAIPPLNGAGMAYSRQKSNGAAFSVKQPF